MEGVVTKQRNESNIFNGIYRYIIILISMAGFVPKHATVTRTIERIYLNNNVIDPVIKN